MSKIVLGGYSTLLSVGETEWLDFHIRRGSNPRLLQLALRDCKNKYRNGPSCGRKRWEECLRGRYLLRGVLDAASAHRKNDLAVNVTRFGKPVISGEDLYVSISHDGTYVVAAVAEGIEIGIDLQVPFEVSPTFAKRWGIYIPQSTGSDAARMLAAEQWSVKEAISKVRGSGIVDLPHKLDVANERRGRSDGINWIKLDSNNAFGLAIAYMAPTSAVVSA
ncbi:hypothetical protein KKI43_24005 [Arthrobacter sp. GN70]|nr:hypothetical protein [Arthrobacter sp. GN70]